MTDEDNGQKIWISTLLPDGTTETVEQRVLSIEFSPDIVAFLDTAALLMEQIEADDEEQEDE